MQRMQWIEAGRTLAMLAIVGWHAVRHVMRMQGPMPDWFDPLAALITAAVPMFFLVSGYLAQRSRSFGAASWPDFLGAKARTLLIPFLIWNTLHALFLHLLFGWPLLAPKTLWFLLTGYIHLWFVFVLLQLTLVHKVIYRACSSRPGLVLLSTVALAVCWYSFSTYLLMVQGDDRHFFEWHWGKLFVGWCAFYFMGVFLGARAEIFDRLDKKFPLMSALAALAFALCWYQLDLESDMYGNYVRHYFLLAELPFQLLFALWTLLALRRVEQRNVPGFGLLAAQGQKTFGIYLMHLMPVFVLWKLWADMGLPMTPWASIPIAAATWLACLIAIRLLQWPRPLGALLLGGR